MTAKQEKILTTALELFAETGYNATSTAKVAKAAGVSEGLIFRHFGNKEGLLQAIMDVAKEKAQAAFGPVLLSRTPQECIEAALEVPFKIKPSDYQLWRLIYTLKWQTQRYEVAASANLALVLEKAFSDLNYPHPKAEAHLLLTFIDGAATSILLHPEKDSELLLQSLKSKYQL